MVQFKVGVQADNQG